MLSKNKIKTFVSLQQKKYRENLQLFVAEGDKIVKELLSSDLQVDCIIALPQWLEANADLQTGCTIPFYEAEEADIRKISSLSTPQPVMAVVHIPKHKLDVEAVCRGMSLVLDGVQDPGNMGTIIRIADWFGVSQLFCSPDCADAFNPKVIQATMGSVARVRVYSLPLVPFLEQMSANKDLRIYGALLNGQDMYKTELSDCGAMIVMGNESKGISSEVEKCIGHKILIPRYTPLDQGAESLNVAIATAIICAEFRRR